MEHAIKCLVYDLGTTWQRMTIKICAGGYENASWVSVKNKRNGIAIRQGQCSERKVNSETREQDIGDSAHTNVPSQRKGATRLIAKPRDLP